MQRCWVHPDGRSPRRVFASDARLTPRAEGRAAAAAELEVGPPARREAVRGAAERTKSGFTRARRARRGVDHDGRKDSRQASRSPREGSSFDEAEVGPPAHGASNAWTLHVRVDRVTARVRRQVECRALAPGDIRTHSLHASRRAGITPHGMRGGRGRLTRQRTLRQPESERPTPPTLPQWRTQGGRQPPPIRVAGLTRVDGASARGSVTTWGGTPRVAWGMRGAPEHPGSRRGTPRETRWRRVHPTRDLGAAETRRARSRGRPSAPREGTTGSRRPSPGDASPGRGTVSPLPRRAARRAHPRGRAALEVVTS